MKKASKPQWLKRPLGATRNWSSTRRVLLHYQVETICERALCPNRSECYACGVATLLLLGGECTRACSFCAVQPGTPAPPDDSEPDRVARTAEALGLKHVVLTSVTRDDLPDGGASHFVRTIRAVRRRMRGVSIEVLVPDFLGRRESILSVADARPDILAHNMETVRRLYPHVRPGAVYQRSLDLLRTAGELDNGMITKSGLMVGLGESRDELHETMRAVRDTGCDSITIGQYLRPSPAHLPVERYVPPAEFDRYALFARKIGFRHVASGPLVRSSYRGDEFLRSKGGNGDHEDQHNREAL